jgi:hypothetical protein
MEKAPESYLDCKRPPILEALRLEGDVTIEEAIRSLQRKGYYAPSPRPWQLGFRDRGMGRVNLVVLDRFGDLVAEVENQTDAGLIISAVNAVKGEKE